MSSWIKLGSGTFNTVYIDSERKLVLKVQKKPQGKLAESDLPGRVVRLWNIINPQLPKAYIVDDEKLGRGVVYPYIEGRQSTDDEMACAVIDIYNKTGRIVVDATAPQNFLTTDTGDVVCVDVGMAVQLERENTFQTGSMRRVPSVVSMDSWVSRAHKFCGFFAHWELFRKMTKSVNMVKALLFIKCHQPSIDNVDFLLTNYDLLIKLNFAYCKQI